jgi:hypothetical protein
MSTQLISGDVFKEEYAKPGETAVADIQARVARALASVESFPRVWKPRFRAVMERGFISAGRIMSAAGTDIYIALRESAKTVRRGGDVGYDFSLIRPNGTQVKGTASNASGPISFMRVFDCSCETVESAGSRRGAQMSLLRCDHPDFKDFIHAKDRAGELTNFNISAAVTDALLRGVCGDQSMRRGVSAGLRLLLSGFDQPDRLVESPFARQAAFDFDGLARPPRQRFSSTPALRGWLKLDMDSAGAPVRQGPGVAGGASGKIVAEGLFDHAPRHDEGFLCYVYGKGVLQDKVATLDAMSREMPGLVVALEVDAIVAGGHPGFRDDFTRLAGEFDFECFSHVSGFPFLDAKKAANLIRIATMR